MFGVELNGTIQKAKVVELDRILIKVHFEEANRFEWIYSGSPRIPKIYRLHLLEKRLDGIIDIQTYPLCRTDDLIFLDTCDQIDGTVAQASATTSTMNQCNNHTVTRHKCSPECVRSEDGVDLEKIALFRRPIVCGWKRTNVRYGRMYQAPCGFEMKSIPEVMDYLTRTESKLRIDSFDFLKNDPSVEWKSQIASISVRFHFYH